MEKLVGVGVFPFANWHMGVNTGPDGYDEKI
jgi:hypothetical protein